jgi:uncharacterized protein YbaR (Trm112 family)
MKKKILNILVCPICKGTLVLHSRKKELVCEKDRLAFPLRNGVPILLESDARRLDD